jgi:hypothetical protein
MTLTCSSDFAHDDSGTILLRTITGPMHCLVVLPPPVQSEEMKES